VIEQPIYYVKYNLHASRLAIILTEPEAVVRHVLVMQTDSRIQRVLPSYREHQTPSSERGFPLSGDYGNGRWHSPNGYIFTYVFSIDRKEILSIDFLAFNIF
jgi:hypothetical protein